MNRKSIVTIGIAVWITVLGFAISAQDKYAAAAVRQTDEVHILPA